MMIRPLILTLILCSAVSVQGKILYEGWNKITVSGQHVGYSVQRYEYDEKKKQYSALSFQKVNSIGGNSTETVEAVSDSKFNPVSYKYTLVDNNATKLIDAKFKKRDENKATAKQSKGTKKASDTEANLYRLEAVITDNGAKKLVKEDLAPNAFLSAFLAYRIMASGLKVGEKYTFQSIAEEDAKAYEVVAFVKEIQEVDSKNVFRVLTQFKGGNFVNLMDASGAILSTRAPDKGIEIKAVNTKDEAVGRIPFSEGSIKVVFGKIPADKSAELTTPAKSEEKKPESQKVETPKPETQKPEDTPKQSEPKKDSESDT